MIFLVIGIILLLILVGFLLYGLYALSAVFVALGSLVFGPPKDDDKKK